MTVNDGDATLDPWVVLYRPKEFPKGTHPLAFPTRAIDGDQAESACLAAHPGSEIVWTMLGDVDDAYHDYWRNDQPHVNRTQYLTVWRHTMDDVPISLHDNYRDAADMARNCPTSTGYKIAGRLGIDCSTPVCWCVYHFDGSGRPTHVTFVRDHADRETDPDMTGLVDSPNPSRE